MSRLILATLAAQTDQSAPGTAVTFTKGRRTLLYIRIRFQMNPTNTDESRYQLMEGSSVFVIFLQPLSIATTLRPGSGRTEGVSMLDDGGFRVQNDAREAAKRGLLFYGLIWTSSLHPVPELCSRLA